MCRDYLHNCRLGVGDPPRTPGIRDRPPPNFQPVVRCRSRNRTDRSAARRPWRSALRLVNGSATHCCCSGRSRHARHLCRSRGPQGRPGRGRGCGNRRASPRDWKAYRPSHAAMQRALRDYWGVDAVPRDTTDDEGICASPNVCRGWLGDRHGVTGREVSKAGNFSCRPSSPTATGFRRRESESVRCFFCRP